MDLQGATDERLLRARGRVAGDAFAEFYRRYERPTLAYFVRRGWDAELAADLSSTTFAEALRARARFRDRGEGSGAAWLYGVARLVHLRQARTSGALDRRDERIRHEQRHLTDAQAAAIEALTEDRALQDALAALPPLQRSAVFAYVVADQSYDEIAEREGIPVATVRKRVSRGLAAIKASQKEGT